MSELRDTSSCEEAVRNALGVLHSGDEVFEIRALGARGALAVGYFDDPALAASAVVRLDRRTDTRGVYVTLNPLNQACLARAVNRSDRNVKASADADVARRRWLLIDLDPVRPAEVSSTAGELRAAKERAALVRDTLAARGWPMPVEAASGNGAHVLYAVALSNDDTATNLIKQCLAALDLQFSDDAVAIDRSVNNAGRIVRLYGTTARKGDNASDRPHRRSALVHVPSKIVPVSRGQLEALAATLPPEQHYPPRSPLCDLRAFLQRNTISVIREGLWNGASKFILTQCPFDSAHTGTSAALIQFSNGAIAFKCFHNACASRGWRDVRELFEPSARDAPPRSIAQYAPAVNGAARVETSEKPEWGDANPWPVLDDAALHGLAGDIVHLIEPHSEADPAALLAHVLVDFGAFVGSGPHYAVEATEQPCRLFTLIVGNTANARKGTARNRIEHVFRIADEETLDAIRTSGLASGEGLIEHLADKQNESGEHVSTEKRTLVEDSEFARVLAVAGREGNTLSATLRGFWDKGEARIMTRKNPLKVRGAHVCQTADITLDEFAEKMPDLEVANGLLNRYLIVCSKRSKLLPFGGNLGDADLAPVARKLRDAIDEARTRERIYMTPEARAVWAAWYCQPPTVGGLLAAATARREPLALRLALTYALLDRCDAIDTVHLRAAFAFWDYCFASARHLFGSRLGDPVADRLLHALRDVYPYGLDGREIDALFNKSLRPGKLDTVRNDLERRDLICRKPEPPGPQGGRPRIRFYAVRLSDKPDKRGQTLPQYLAAEVCPVNPVCPADIEEEL